MRQFLVVTDPDMPTAWVEDDRPGRADWLRARGYGALFVADRDLADDMARAMSLDVADWS